MMKIYIIRHGETNSNIERRMQGWIDNPLNEKGVRLAKITGSRMKDIHFDACISSPLKRAYQTAQIILEESGNGDVPIQTDDRIKEICFGDYEGLQLDSEPLMTEEAMRFFKEPLMAGSFPGGEAATDVCARTQDFLKELAARDDDQTYLIATHGCALRAMLNFLYEDPSNFWQEHVPYNCAVDIITVEDGKITLDPEERIYYDPAEAVDPIRAD